MNLIGSARTVAAAVAVAGLVAACGGAGGPRSDSGELTGDKIVLAVLNDRSDVYADLSGENSVVAVEMAVEDFTAEHGDEVVTEDIEVVFADHQNKPDVANSKAQELYDRQDADVILDVPTSSAALAVATQAAQKQKLYLNVTAATTELTGAQCNKYTFHYAYDTYMLANGTGRAVTERGAKNWHIVYPDYAFGQDMERSFSAAVEEGGGTVVGRDPTPFPNDNFSTFLLKSPGLRPKPDVLGTMQAGGDLVNLVKQYNEFNLRDQGVDLAVGLLFSTDITSIGAAELAGTVFTTAWDWNMDEQSREWSDRFHERTGIRPTFAHAGNYSAAMQYLQAVQRAGTDGADEIVAELEGHEFDDFFARNATVRPEDHRVVHDAYLAEVVADSDDPDATVEILETIPADQAFTPLAESSCKLS